MRLLLAATGEGWDPTPAASGFAVAAMMVLAALGASRAGPWHRKYGVPSVLLLLLALQIVVVFALGFVSALAIPVLQLRALPQAVAAPVAEAAIHPRLSSSERATFLSLVSLFSRGSFALVLAGIGAAVGPMESLEREVIARVANVGAATGTAALSVLWLFSRPGHRIS